MLRFWFIFKARERAHTPCIRLFTQLGSRVRVNAQARWGSLFRSQSTAYSLADGGRNKLADDDDAEYGEENQGDLAPLEQVDGGVEEDADAAGAGEAENGEFADVDVPALDDGPVNDGQYLGKDAEPGRLEAGGAGGFDGLHHALVDLLDGLDHELAHEAD